MSHADTIRHALAVLLQECGESPSTEAGLAYSGAHRAVNQMEALASAAPTPEAAKVRALVDVDELDALRRKVAAATALMGSYERDAKGREINGEVNVAAALRTTAREIAIALELPEAQP